MSGAGPPVRPADRVLLPDHPVTVQSAQTATLCVLLPDPPTKKRVAYFYRTHRPWMATSFIHRKGCGEPGFSVLLPDRKPPPPRTFTGPDAYIYRTSTGQTRTFTGPSLS